MKRIKIVSLFVLILLLAAFFVTFSINSYALSDEVYEVYEKYDISLFYMGYFEENITLYALGEPSWIGLINGKTWEPSNITFETCYDGKVVVVFNDPQHQFTGRSFFLLKDDMQKYVYSNDIFDNNSKYRLELRDTGGYLCVEGKYQNYAFDVQGCTTWQDLINSLEYTEKYMINVIDGIVFIDGYAIDDPLGEYVNVDSVIDINNYYTLGGQHGHYWEDTGVSQEGTCSDQLILYQKCIYCDATREYEADWWTYEHNWIIDDDVPADCEFPGYISGSCEWCGETYYEEREPLGHNMTEPDCYNSGICKRSGCNATIKALGHDLNEIGWCSRCGYDHLLKSEDSEDKFNFEEWWSGIEQWFTDAGKDVNNFFVKISNGIKATAIVCGIFVFLVGVYYVLSFINNVNTFKDRWKEKRNNRQNKGNKRK